MRHYLVKTFVFFLLFFAIDRFVGFCLNSISSSSTAGESGHWNYILNQMDEEVLIFGSSKAAHNYNPSVLKDILKMSCFNCGQDGNGVILYYAWWLEISKRYKPTLIICDVTPWFDFVAEDDNNKHLGLLKNIYSNDDVKAIFEAIDPMEKYKMSSWMYRYNSKFHQVLADHFLPIYHVQKNGFKPLPGDMDTLKIKKEKNNNNIIHFDSLKIDFINKFIKATEGIKRVFVISPEWYDGNPNLYQPIKDICQRNEIPLIDYSQDTTYVHQNEYFKDGMHLNEAGAEVFSRDVANKLVKILDESN